jgi:hypothetical protein
MCRASTYIYTIEQVIKEAQWTQQAFELVQQTKLDVRHTGQCLATLGTVCEALKDLLDRP